jgi:polyhydroxyalkanoate synthase
MTTNSYKPLPEDEAKVARLDQNLGKVEALTQRLVNALAHKRQVPPALQGPAGELYAKAATAWWAEMMANPARLIEHQVSYWGDTLKHYVAAQHALMQGKFEPPEDKGPKDKRFSNPLWDSHPYFNFVKQQYLPSRRRWPRSMGSIRRSSAGSRISRARSST